MKNSNFSLPFRPIYETKMGMREKWAKWESMVLLNFQLFAIFKPKRGPGRLKKESCWLVFFLRNKEKTSTLFEFLI